MKLKTKTKLVIQKDGRGILGPGIIDLLKNIEKTGSTKKGTELLGMSYSKALRIIKIAEDALGFNLIEKSRGGIFGGESILTDKGNRIIDSYEKMKKEIEKETKLEYIKEFSWLEEIID